MGGVEVFALGSSTRALITGFPHTIWMTSPLLATSTPADRIAGMEDDADDVAVDVVDCEGEGVVVVSAAGAVVACEFEDEALDGGVGGVVGVDVVTGAFCVVLDDAGAVRFT